MIFYKSFVVINIMNDKIIIPLSKKKATIALVGSVLFVVAGYLMTINPENFISPICRSPEIIRVTGIVGVAFFGLCLIFIARKLFDNKPGLIIDEYGITDNTNATSVGLVEWGDITGIVTKKVMSNKFLILQTNNPAKYIDRAKNVITKQAMNINYKTYDSPLSIISNSLKIDFDDLEKLIMSEFEKRKTLGLTATDAYK